MSDGRSRASDGVQQGALPVGSAAFTGPALPARVTPLGIDARRDALVRRPAAGDAPAPLLVVLHGAGGSARLR